MENFNQHKIDQLFNEESKSAEENTTFPSFEKVWTNIEKRLDEKEKRKRIFPIWFPYGIAASLAIGLGVLYFYNQRKVEHSNSIATITSRQKFNSEKIDSVVKQNIQKELIVEHSPKKEQQILKKNNLAFNEEPKTQNTPTNLMTINKQNDFYAIRKSKYTTDESYIRKKENVVATEKSNEPVFASPIKEPEILADAAPDKVYAAEIASEKTKDISEVVVTGLGMKAEKKALAYSTSSLEGKATGISIASSKKSSDVIIRGVKSLDIDEKPLVVVNGEILDYNILELIDSKKISTVSVLKDAKATALYGEKGKNGVILIETKNISKSELNELNEKAKKIESSEKKDIEEKKLPKAGQLTAGEINDFSKWDYWQDIAAPTLKEYQDIWKIFPKRRVSVQLINKTKIPIIGMKVKLFNENHDILWEGVTDNTGKAELWITPKIDLNQDFGKYLLADENNTIISDNVAEFSKEPKIIMVNKQCSAKRNLDLAFVVDATGSMGDEISYLQSELLDVLNKVEQNLPNTSVRYGSVFYRDFGDEYVTRKSDFTNSAENLIQFIKQQSANGGGDTPEAVVEALDESINQLGWSRGDATKLMFLILDAPPHISDSNIDKIFEKIKIAAQKGIMIIPLAASDTDKQTEYLLRTFALLTNGTYTFLTDDSGIGNSHIKPTAESYQVEKLNDLLLRLILQRSSLPKCETGEIKEYLNKQLEVEANRSKDLTIKIYPNPAKDFVTVDSAQPIEELIMYDFTGKIVMRKENLRSGKNSIDISSYPQSIYLIRLKCGETWQTVKIMKK